ncbi:MAG: helix-turn-helix transcriptional regulator [Lewinellaceae bacterium]|nr:helix-turn-helix transcriptional regulator [Lewinellaceae bacterium]
MAQPKAPEQAELPPVPSGLSQEALAWKADLELSQISRIERGVINTSVSQLFSIAEALEVPMAALFEFEMPKTD